MGSRAGRILVTLVALQVPVGPAAAQAPSAHLRGVLIDPVVSPSNPAQRYVLYVPAGLDPERPAPVLLIMDYRGRGRVAAELFRPAAERLGWILVSSYNTASDGAGELNLTAVKTMLFDVRNQYVIDESRLYLAGLSGTARMATLIAQRSGVRFEGVIGAAAGFPPEAPPSTATSFLYFGTAGDIDYNYWEMRGLEERLKRLGLPHRIAFFPGRHGWMPPELAESALFWMQLRAMGAGGCDIDRAFVDERWARDLDRSRMLERDGRQWEASRLLTHMAGDYARLRPADELAEVTRRASELGASGIAIEQAKAAERAAKAHDVRVARALQIISEAFPAQASEPATTLGGVIADLDVKRLRQVSAGSDTEAALAAARVLAQLNVQTGFYLPASALATGDDERAKFYLGIALAIDPDDSYAWYLRGVVASRGGQATIAMDALERAVALGFRTVDLLEHDRSLDSLRKRSDFIALVNRLRDAVR